MTSRFDAAEADRRWQVRWDEARAFEADSASAKPSRLSWSRIAAMFDRVQVPGWIPRSIAAFSAGIPNASQPIG